MRKVAGQFWNNPGIILLILLIAGILYLLSSILLPFLASAILAYLTDPLVKKLMRFHLSRTLAVIIVFFGLLLGIVLFLLILIPLFQQQIVILREQLPSILNWLQATSSHLLRYFNNITNIQKMIAENLMRTESMTNVLAEMLSSGKSIFESLLNIILIPVVTFYFLRDWDRIIIALRDTLPQEVKPSIINLVKECDSVLGAFSHGQFLVMLFFGIFYAITLTMIGLKLGLAIGIIIFVGNIVPYLGFVVGLAIAVIAAYAQMGTLTAVLLVLLDFAIGYSIDNFYLTPKLVGDRIGLHPVIVIFAMLAGGTLFGFFGVLLALPVAAVVVVLLRHLHRHYLGIS